MSDVENLQKQIDDLTNTQIASISLQVSNIQKSIGELTEVDTELNRLIGGLRQDLARMEENVDPRYQELKQAVEGLEREEAALDQRIKDLKTYCDTQDEGTRDWVTATFITLEQHGAVLGEIAGIKTRLGELTQMISDTESRLNAAIGRAESSVKAWVSEQLTGYYTIAQMDARLKVLEEGYEAGDATLTTEISTLRNSIETAKTDLTSAYRAAIASAIEENNGVINAKIAADIKTATDTLQGQIDAIRLRLDNAEARLSALEASVAQLIGMIQSIAVVPDFSDGSAALSYAKNNQLRFEVYPLEAAAAIAEKGTSVLSLGCVETLTKSSEAFVNLPVSSVSFTGKTLLLTVDGTVLPNDVISGKKTVNARLNITDGTFSKNSAFFPLTMALVPVDLGLSVKWASMNLGALRPGDPGDYYAWGETETYYSSLNPLVWKEGKEEGYNWASYSLCDGSMSTLNKYNTVSTQGTVDYKTTLEMIDDAARVNLGGKWRMPTRAEWDELRSSSFCYMDFETYNGMPGMLISSESTGQSVFFPFGGIMSGTELLEVGNGDSFWASTLCVEDPTQADRISISTESARIVINTRVRRRGQLIRAVWDE